MIVLTKAGAGWISSIHMNDIKLTDCLRVTTTNYFPSNASFYASYSNFQKDGRQNGAAIQLFWYLIQ